MRQWLEQWFLNFSEPSKSPGRLASPLSAVPLHPESVIQHVWVGPEDLHL